MTHIPVIGLMGQKGSGKDAFAEFLVLGHGYTRLAFADVMKDALMVIDPYIPTPREDGLYAFYRLSVLVKRDGWDVVKREYPEVRTLLQRFGTELGREVIGEDVWVNILEQHMKKLLLQGNEVVITDVRFENEAALVKRAGGMLVRIDRPGLEDSDQHKSEREWRNVPSDWTYGNDGTLEQMERAAWYVAHGSLDGFDKEEVA